VTWVGVAGFEPVASSSRTSGGAGRLAAVPAHGGCGRWLKLVAVGGRCCTRLLYRDRPHRAGDGPRPVRAGSGLALVF